MEKHKTSIYSEYDKEHDSVSSKQLQYWLQQTAPFKKGQIDWTLQTNKSHAEDDVGLRCHTFESANKENQFHQINVSSSCRTDPSKSKAYASAMQTLQNKVQAQEKQLYSINQYIATLQSTILKAEQSSTLLNNTVQTLEKDDEEKKQKSQKLNKENKMLRSLKSEQQLQLKLLEKQFNEAKLRLQQNEQQLEKTTSLNAQQQQVIDSFKQAERKSLDRVKFLQRQNYELKEIKEKSVVELLAKYSKTVELNQELHQQNNDLRNEIVKLQRQTEKYSARENHFLKQKEELHLKKECLEEQLTQSRRFTEELKRQNIFLQSINHQNQETMHQLRNQQVQQLKQYYKSIASDLAKNQNTIIAEGQNSEFFIQHPILHQTVVEPSNQSFSASIQCPIESSSILTQSKYFSKIPNPDKSKNKSVQKAKPSVKEKRNSNKSQNKSQRRSLLKKQLDDKSFKDEKEIRAKAKDVNSNSKEESLIQSKYEKSRKKSFAFEKQLEEREGQNQFIFGEKHERKMDEVDSEALVKKTLLMEAQKEALSLYDEQLELFLQSSGKCTQVERAECFGRIRQINMQIQNNSDKIIHLKSS